VAEFSIWKEAAIFGAGLELWLKRSSTPGVLEKRAGKCWSAYAGLPETDIHFLLILCSMQFGSHYSRAEGLEIQDFSRLAERQPITDRQAWDSPDWHGFCHHKH
jgi:hypothetical protein